MKKEVSILIVEDDMIIAANISVQLTKLGYVVTGIASRGEDAIAHTRLNPPDIILMDINLKGKLNGIETASLIQQEEEIPIVYLTANNDEATFSRARKTHPHAFISKPFSILNLRRTIALVAEQLSDIRKEQPIETPALQVLKDRIFIRHNGKMVKLLLQDILYIEAERNYCNIVTTKARFLVVCTLKTIEQELPDAFFLRVHRSFVVNISKLDVLAETYLEIGRKVIPISRSYKDSLLSRLHLI